jgi:pyruvate,orthophosphate dikinase
MISPRSRPSPPNRWRGGRVLLLRHQRPHPDDSEPCDDAGKFPPEHVERGILPGDPFVSLDPEGVGVLVEWAVERGRRARPKLKVGICGEHGGDPASVEFCHRAGLDYVSCSPFRVPIARLAAAQASVRGKATGSDQR